jgi:hypothetical protein
MKSSGQMSPQPARRSVFRRALGLVLAGIVLAVIVIVVFPLVFEPRIDVPTDLETGNPSVVQVQISNQNLTPLLDVEYTCELSTMILANGTAVPNEKVLVRGTIRKIGGRSAAAAGCQAAYVVTSPLGAAAYKMTITYRSYLWHGRRTRVYPISAKVNTKGDVTGWKLD